jgi:endonuclease I
MRFKFLLTFILINISIALFAQIPAGYYDGTEGLVGDNLRNALRGIITSGHTSNDYDNLEDDFYYTDNIGGNKVWDMYSMDASGTADYYFYYNSSDECGNYDEEGDCYNKEHSFPKSWWGGGSAIQYADLFHLVPTDGYVNNRRSNYPFGEVGSTTWVSSNGSKVGSCNYPGYTGTVFEPIDEFKGDFARNYFYMATRYMNSFSGWSSDMISGNNYTVWARNMLLQWHHDDPVSQKEIDRNNAVYNIQHNRNPYIDNPEWADAVWDPNYVPNYISTSKVFFDVYPNPASEYVMINCTFAHDENSTIDIIDLTGREVYSKKLTDVIENIDITKLPEGVYIVSISLQDRKLIQKVSVVR